MTPRRQRRARRYCGARKKQGPGTCKRPAGWGTETPGRGKCKLHGGATPSHRIAAAREAALEAVATYGLPREVEPHEALLEEVYRTAGHVAWLGQVIAGLEREHLVSGVTKTTQTHPLADEPAKRTPGASKGRGRPDAEAESLKAVKPASERIEAAAAINVWVRLYQSERDRLVRVAKAAVDAGVAERQVEIAEAQARQLAEVIKAILADLGHDLGDEEVRETVRLRLVEGGKAS